MPQRYVDAALANPFVRECRTEESIRQEPPIRLRFEEASAYGLLGECICAVQSKSWGPLVGVEPIEPDFPFDGQRIQYRFHESSRYNRRFEQRQYLKRRLGKGLRKLVGVAMARTQALFLKHLSAGDEAAIRARHPENQPWFSLIADSSGTGTIFDEDVGLFRTRISRNPVGISSCQISCGLSTWARSRLLR